MDQFQPSPGLSFGGTDATASSVQTCVVYDRSTGVVRHIHQVITVEGAAATSDDQLAERALHLARELTTGGLPGLDGEQDGETYGELETLTVDATELDLNRPHRVDVSRRTLVPEQA